MARPPVYFIFLTLLLDVISLGVVIPVLPLLLKELTGGDSVQASYWVGIFAFTWALTQFCVSPLWGALSDRFGRRVVILTSCFGLAADHLLSAFATSVIWLLVARLLSAFFAANYGAVNAYIADVVTAKERTKVYGFVGASWGLGFVIGPALGSFFGGIDLRYPFFLAAALTFANALYGLLVLPESLPRERRTSRFGWHHTNPLKNLHFFFDNRQLSRLLVINALYFVAHYSLTSVFVLYSSSRYGWGAREVGLALTWVGVLGFVVQGFLVRLATQHFKDKTLLSFGLAAGSIGFVLIASAPTPLAFYLALIPFSFIGFTMPPLQSLMTQRIAEEHQGALQGANGSINALCGFFAPLLFTHVFGLYLHSVVGAPFYLAGVFTLVGFVLATRVVKQ